MYIENGKSPVMLICSRYNMEVEEANSIVSNWLAKNSQRSSCDLYNLIIEGSVVIKKQDLFEIPHLSLQEATALVVQLQENYNLEVKDRWYHLKCYRNCFIGSEFVDCLVENANVLEGEAIVWGKDLVRHKLIAHVCNDHDFKNDFLFYRFLE